MGVLFAHMNWLVVLVSLFLKIRSDNSKLEIKQVFLFENNFWDPPIWCIETGEGYLYAFKFLDEIIEQPVYDMKTVYDFYLDCDSNLRYVEMSEDMEEKILFGLNSSKVDKNFIRIQFLTTDRLVVDSEEYKNYKGRKLNYEAHLWVEKLIDDNGIINLEFDEDKSRIIYIKEKFKLLIGESLYRFIDKADTYISLKELEKDKNFELCRFLSYYGCFKNFKIFLKNSQFFGLSESHKDGEDTNKAIMHPTKFMKRINKMIKEDIENLSGGVSEKNMFSKFCASFVCGSCKSKGVSDKTAALITYKSLLEKCFDDLKSKMLKKEIFFHVGGKYDADYYFKELYNQASELINEYQEDYEIADSEDKNVVFQEISKSFCDSLKKLQKKVIDELFESDFIHEQFSKLLGKDFKTKDDIYTIENIILDYLNILTYLSELYKKSDKSDLCSFYYPLNFNHSIKCKIVSYLKITLKTKYSNNFGKIEAFNEKDERVEFEKNVHYYIKLHKNCEFYCASKILRKLSIKKIKITTSEVDDLCKMVKVDEYLRN